MARYGKAHHHAALFVGKDPFGKEGAARDLERRDAPAADPVTKDRA